MTNYNNGSRKPSLIHGVTGSGKTFTMANIIEKAGKGSKAGGSIDVADSVYHENLTELFTKWQKDYGVNYWKWDGFADSAQYGAFAAADGVPGY